MRVNPVDDCQCIASDDEPIAGIAATGVNCVIKRRASVGTDRHNRFSNMGIDVVNDRQCVARDDHAIDPGKTAVGDIQRLATVVPNPLFNNRDGECLSFASINASVGGASIVLEPNGDRSSAAGSGRWSKCQPAVGIDCRLDGK
jgi:hypothetical protein